MKNITKEIEKIGKIINEVNFLDIIKSEVNAAMEKNIQARVIGAEYTNNPNYDVIIKHNGNEKINNKITRRLKKAIKNIEIKDLDSLVNNVVLGVRLKKNRKSQ